MSDNYRLFLNGIEDKKIGSLSWIDNIDELSTQLQYQTLNRVYLGSIFHLFNGKKEIIRGIVTNEEYDKVKIYSYTGFDYGFYLNKNEVTIQFNGESGKQAIVQLLTSVNIPVGSIVDLPVKIKKIYKKVVVSDIINEILANAEKKTGIKYSIKVQYGKVNVIKSRDILINAYYDLSGKKINITDTVSDFSAQNSIQDMKNKVIVTDSGDKDVKILACAQDNNSIAKYGLLQHVETKDNDEKASNASIANNILKELNKIAKTKSIEMLGSDDVISGVVLNFNYPELDFSAKYYVKQVEHNVSSGVHKIRCSVEAYA